MGYKLDTTTLAQEEVVQYVPEKDYTMWLLEGLLKVFPRAQVPGIVITMARAIDYDPITGSSRS